jgi:hypothetical protein
MALIMYVLYFPVFVSNNLKIQRGIFLALNRVV